MIALLLCWLVAPLGLLVICIGLSLLVERLAGFALPWTIRPAVGIAAAIVIAQFGTATDSTAELTVPVILVVALVGLVIGTRARVWREPPDGFVLAAAAFVFLVYAAPFLASGSATWAGIIKLDDSATWFALTEHAFEFGRGVGELPASTHAVVIADYFSTSYPIGGFVPMKLMSSIVGEDVAWTMHPSMAFAAAILTVLTYELVRPLVERRGAAALIAAVGPLSAILIGYALWGGVKELAAAALLPLGPALVAYVAKEGWPRAAFVPVAVALAAFVAVLGPGGAVWLVPLMIPALLLLYRQRDRRTSLRIAGSAAALTILLSLPVIFTPEGVFSPLDDSLTAATELGNLTGPLNPLHISGIWPSRDFRSDPHLEPVALGLGVACLLLAGAALVACARFREGKGLPFAGYAGGGAVGALAIIALGSPWVDGKAMATISPALLAAAMLAIVIGYERTPFRVEARVLGAALVAFAAWGALLAYQGVWLAPRDHYTELEEIAERFEGEGPTLVGTPSIYGPRHFLRKLDPDGPTDRRPRSVVLTGGGIPADDQQVDLDQIEAGLDQYNLVIVRRGPTQSRPPAGFALAYLTDHYEVWERRGAGAASGPPQVRLPLGNELDAGDFARCPEVKALADQVGPEGTLIAATTTWPVTVHIGQTERPQSWNAPTSDTVAPDSSGTLTSSFRVPLSGEYQLWLEGQVAGKVEILVNGRPVDSARSVINLGAYEPLARVRLEAETDHQLELRYSGAGLAPGSAVVPFGLGPVIFDMAPDESSLVTVPATDYAELCDRRWDWIEAYG